MVDTPVPNLVVPRLIVGLGNPGDKYAGTRHNIGFEILEALSKRWQISLKEDRRFQGAYGDGLAPGNAKVSLLKPSTYMNRSGQSMRSVIDWFKIAPESVLVIYDDMDLPIGKLRLRLSGSAGGHNGMKSAIAHLSTQEFPRLRVGIGSTNKTGDRDSAVVSHVLGKFSPTERQQMDAVVYEAAKAIEMSLKEGVEKAMSLYNGREITV
ncbi:aminoacyl-tRNA hydrolase [Pseudanabaena sp. FACHB-2040]|uniref:aminoacyl-tRNA hydrolase n=1 Tax=Pseudanabaena sp. FACHB-2040 TaxID=2692859 RepID=UPI00168313D0|nr:aminoacyl-tRNA hydrolase [Pseudanabaena sp. FACHB-2040]MBD2260753.1 aminoacyl-tRNA hydrolase [Pseudanabaena sp. FACHB-2040]